RAACARLRSIWRPRPRGPLRVRGRRVVEPPRRRREHGPPQRGRGRQLHLRPPSRRARELRLADETPRRFHRKQPRPREREHEFLSESWKADLSAETRSNTKVREEPFAPDAPASS